MIPWRDSGNFDLEFSADGHVPAPAEEHPRATVRIISPGFFATLGLPIIEGRDFNDAGRTGSERVAIVSQSVAQRMFPKGDALNQHVMWTDPVLKAVPRLSIEPQRIIGIVADMDDENVVPVPAMTVYRPFDQEAVLGGKRLFVHVRSNPNALVTPITRIMRGMSADQFRQSQKMEAVGRLAGGLAHDFNNLLTIITGYSQMVLDGLEADEPQRGSVEEVLRAAETAAALTSQLLAFSRRQIVQPQVLMNLVVNARDAMPEGGRITIETSDVSIDETQAPETPGLSAGPYAALSVIGTGRGMDEETRGRLFEPFFTAKGRGKGTGLGLSTAYGIVKQCGGDIWVQTEPGKGTQFRIYLPAAEATAAAGVRAAAPPAPQSGTETVLLVEDEAGLRKVVREVLQTNGCDVLQAGDVREALRVCEQHLGPIHLFLTDVVMPRMNGLELAQRALALRPRMKVLYMSGYADNTILPPGEIEGGSSSLQKPFPPDVLLAKVRQAPDKK